MKLQCLLKHNYFVSKCAKQNNKKMIIITILQKFKKLEIKQYEKSKNYLVFIKVLNFFGQIPISTHALFHSTIFPS